MLPHDCLSRNEHKGMLDEPSYVVAGLMLRPLKGIGSQVEQHGQPELNHRLLPDAKSFGFLFHEYGLPLLVAKAGKVAVIRPVEELTALVRTLAAQQVALVVAVEMNLEILAGRIVALRAACS